MRNFQMRSFEAIRIGSKIKISVYTSLIMMMLVSIFSPSDSYAGFIYTASWGSLGSGDGQFDNPSGIAVDSSANVYVADCGNNRVQKFDSNGNFLGKWGSLGAEDGQFSCPSAVAVNSSGEVYVADSGNNRIQKFDSNGNFLMKWGSFGNKRGEFWFGPHFVAIDSSGIVYAVSSGNGLIQQFDGNGNFIKRWSSWVPIVHCTAFCWNDSCPDYCTDMWAPFPTAIAVDSASNVYVIHNSELDDIASAVFVYDSNGRYLTRWGSPGRGDGQLGIGPTSRYYNLGPLGIAIDKADNVYVADTENGRFQKFNSKGKFLSKQSIGRPHGITVDSSGNVYVADTGNHFIQKFEQTFRIKGAVKKADGTSMAGVLMTLSGGISATATTDSSGKYKFTDVPNGSYTVTPSKEGYDFFPVIADVTIYGGDVAVQDITSATFLISGTVKKANGIPIAGVTMFLTGDTDTVVWTDGNGKFKFNRVTGGNYTITPYKVGFAFTPASITLNLNGANVKGQNFTGAKSLILISPNGGEKIHSGSTYQITWEGDTSTIVKFTLKYSLDNGHTWKTIASDITGTSYDWFVPVTPNNIKTCLVRVIGYDNINARIEDKSDAPFSIEVVGLTSSNGGEQHAITRSHERQPNSYQEDMP